MKKVTKKQVDTARKTVRDAAGRANQLEEIYNNQTLEPLRRKHVGRCFKQTNCFSDGESWWLYTRITGVEDGQCVGIEVERNCYGKVSADHKILYGYYADRPNEQYQPITPEEFLAAVLPMLAELTALAKVEE